MNSSSNPHDLEWLRSMGFEEELIDSPEGGRLIRVIFGGEAEHVRERGPATLVEADHGFACVA